MYTPFKAGDRVVATPGEGAAACLRPGQLYTVAAVSGPNVMIEGSYINGLKPYSGLLSSNFRAAVCGVDYNLTPAGIEDTYQGHCADGSSVQKHSAGGLYPCVLVYRDKKGGPNDDGKYDVGVISPVNQDPIWCKHLDGAVRVAESIKEERS